MWIFALIKFGVKKAIILHVTVLLIIIRDDGSFSVFCGFCSWVLSVWFSVFVGFCWFVGFLLGFSVLRFFGCFCRVGFFCLFFVSRGKKKSTY